MVELYQPKQNYEVLLQEAVKEHAKIVDRIAAYYSKRIEVFKKESQESAYQISQLVELLTQLQKTFQDEKKREESIIAETESLSFKLEIACDVVKHLQIDLIDHQLELDFESVSRRAVSKQMLSLNIPPDDPLLVPILAKSDTIIAHEEEEIRKLEERINSLNEEVSEHKSKLKTAKDMLIHKQDDMKEIEKCIENTKDKIERNQHIIDMDEESVNLFTKWLKKLCSRRH